MFEARLNALVASEEAEGKAPFAFEVDYGERAEHCWNGKPPPPRCCWHLGLLSPQSGQHARGATCSHASGLLFVLKSQQ